jgi:hypothetical protein
MVFSAFIAAFSQMLLAALVDLNCLAVHGGIGPAVELIQQLRDIKRTITEFDDSVLNTNLWSDQTDDIDMFQKSMRSTGHQFGRWHSSGSSSTTRSAPSSAATSGQRGLPEDGR